MARLKAATRTSIPSDQTGAFDQIVQERGSIPELGPIGAMIHVPELTQRGEVLREYLRGDLTSLPAQTRELAMILTAREMDCQYIWHAHAGFARESGLSDELVKLNTNCLNGRSIKRSLGQLSERFWQKHERILR